MSAFNVAKFGGTSVANFEAMSRCAVIVENNPSTKLVVSSACSGVTNLLVELANGVNSERRKQLIDQLTELHNSVIDELADPLQTENQVHQVLKEAAISIESNH